MKCDATESVLVENLTPLETASLIQYLERRYQLRYQWISVDDHLLTMTLTEERSQAQQAEEDREVV